MFWSYMKKKTSNRVTVGPLVRDREVITDDKQMCDVLNQQYCSVFTKEDLANLPEVEQNFPYSEDQTRFGQKFFADWLAHCVSPWLSSSPPAWLKDLCLLTGSWPM